MAILSKIPVGIQTFEIIREEGYVYVDKTTFLVKLIDTGKVFFLARPRRFGKSLTISTFESLFTGKKELFKGLDAEEFMNRPNYQPSPVIWLDMSMVSTCYGRDGITESILGIVEGAARTLKVKLPNTNLPGKALKELICLTAEKYNQKVVILLDEYDKPYTDFVNNTDKANEVRDMLRDFYSQIKANDRYIRFTFITGISKFAKLGVFSTLNTLEDISLTPEFTEMCGYTEEEIIRYFPDWLDETAQFMQISTDELIEKMRHYYNGFCFNFVNEKRLYNPFWRKLASWSNWNSCLKNNRNIS